MMLKKFVKVRAKLLSGFLGILILAGFACFSGVRGIQRINYQNQIGIIVKEALVDAQHAQAAALRYIIYEDEAYYNLSLELIDQVIGQSKAAADMMTVIENKSEAELLLLKADSYRGQIIEFRELELRKKAVQSVRINEGLGLIELLHEMTLNGQMSRQSIKLAQNIIEKLNDLRTTALNYFLEKTEYGRNIIAASWLEELGMIKNDLIKIQELSESEPARRAVDLSIAGLEDYSRQVEIFHDLSTEQWKLQYRQREMSAIVMAQGEIVGNGVQRTTAEVTRGAVTTMSVTLGLAILFSIFIAVILSYNITVPLVKGTEVARNIADGKLQKAELDTHRRDELGELAMALERMSGSLKVQHWLQQGKQGLDDELRGDQQLEELAAKFIKYITVHIGAQIGAFYLYDGEQTLDLTASYAFKDRAGNFNSIKIGEGLVGQAAKEREVIYFSRIDDGPVYNFGVEEKVPTNILAAPLVFKQDLIGTFLIGSFDAFSAQQQQFVENNLTNIAILFNAAKSRETIKRLYSQAQQQQDELREINVELELQTEALRESEAELQAQQEELRVTNEELEERTEAIEQQRDSIRIKNDDLQRAQIEIEKKAEDLEQASRYKSEFLANMSHELRTPLNSILILAQLLAGNKEGTLSEKQIKSASAIHSSGADLLKLINEILDLSKVEAGKVEIHYEDLQLSRLEDDLERIFRASAEEKGIELSFTLSSGLPESIRTDSHRLQQILRNLLTNAVKFTEKGFVKFAVERPGQSWKELSPDDYIVFTVEDSGIGISKEKQAAVFEAFQQADGSTIRKYGGTGLGLSISRELAKLLGGEIQLESVEGTGSTFSLILPVYQHAAAYDNEPLNRKIDPPSATPAVPAFVESPDVEIPDDRDILSRNDRCILIVEDDAGFLKILVELIREKDFKVLIARDGETGLHFADYYRPSAIILDIGLPGIDGWTVMERLKSNHELRHIPVHFMSGHDDTLQAMRMGAVGYLTKPVSLDDVNMALCKLERIVSTSMSRLLVVEDDDIQRESIRELIGNGDVEITDLSTGAEAYQALQEDCFDCMILDLGLRDMSGFELLEKIQNDPSCSRIPIIIYTGRDLSREEEETLQNYAESIIIKGVKSPERLLNETSLFLHRVESKLPEDKQQLLREIHDKEAVLEGKTILLVDDDMRNVFAITNILEDKDLKVVVARDGIEALEKLDVEPGIDLVLMDIMMPRMDGYEAMTEIRKDLKLKKLPIIALTAKAMKGDRHRCIEAGASDYLAKPVDTEKLLSMLRVWLY